MMLQEKNIWQSATGSAGIIYRLDSLQHISFDFDYLFYDNNNPSRYDISFLNSHGEETERQITQVSKKTPINFKIAKVDYVNRLSGSFEIEAGLKGTLSRFNNNVNVETFINGQQSSDNALSNNSNLDEKIFGAYFSWQWDMTKNTTLNGGLRYEFTDSFLSTLEERGMVDREFGNFFPSLFISKKLTDQSKLQMAYSKRITRPTFNEMAPYVFFIGPSTFVGGNLNLKPAITDGIDLT
jgi:outer membrane receptor protein involved in Fe transport